MCLEYLIRAEGALRSWRGFVSVWNTTTTKCLWSLFGRVWGVFGHVSICSLTIVRGVRSVCLGFVCFFVSLFLSLFPGFLVCMYVCLFVCLFVCSFVRSFVCLFVCLFICLFVDLFICLFVCLFVRLFVCLLNLIFKMHSKMGGA